MHGREAVVVFASDPKHPADMTWEEFHAAFPEADRSVLDALRRTAAQEEAAARAAYERENGPGRTPLDRKNP